MGEAIEKASANACAFCFYFFPKKYNRAIRSGGFFRNKNEGFR